MYNYNSTSTKHKYRYKHRKFIDRHAISSAYYSNNLSVKDLMLLFNCSVSSVSKSLREFGVKLNKMWRVRKIMQSKITGQIIYGITIPKKTVEKYKLADKKFGLKVLDSGNVIIHELIKFGVNK